MPFSFSGKHLFVIFKLLNLAIFLPFALITVVFSFSCANPETQRIMVFSAASLVDVLQETAPEFEKQTGTKLIFNFAGSQTLAGEISNGGPADIFISAGHSPARFLVERGHIKEENILELVENVLVVATSDDGEYVNISDIAELANMHRIAIADPDLAPAGEYAKEALHNIGIWSVISRRTILAADVRTALAYVQTGDVDAAVVYITDVSIAKGVSTKLFINGMHHTPIVYPAAVVENAREPVLGKEYLDFLTTAYASSGVEKYGFASVKERIN